MEAGWGWGGRAGLWVSGVEMEMGTYKQEKRERGKKKAKQGG